MSSLPNSKSSFFHAARNCESALALASLKWSPMTPVLARCGTRHQAIYCYNAPTAIPPPLQLRTSRMTSFTVVYGITTTRTT